MMSRRRFLLTSAAVFGTPRGSEAQPPRNIRIGILANEPSTAIDGLREGLRELGYVEGQHAAFAMRHKLPAVYPFPEHAHAGGLLTYATSYRDLFRRSATPIDRIVKGAKPGDLPIEQPTKFELLVNMKTAKALGLTVPPALLLRADQVIE